MMLTPSGQAEPVSAHSLFHGMLQRSGCDGLFSWYVQGDAKRSIAMGHTFIERLAGDCFTHLSPFRVERPDPLIGGKKKEKASGTTYRKAVPNLKAEKLYSHLKASIDS